MIPPDPWAVLGWLLQRSCQAGMVIGMIVLVRACVRRHLPPAWRYRLWLLLLCVLVLPVLPANRLSCQAVAAQLSWPRALLEDAAAVSPQTVVPRGRMAAGTVNSRTSALPTASHPVPLMQSTAAEAEAEAEATSSSPGAALPQHLAAHDHATSPPPKAISPRAAWGTSGRIAWALLLVWAAGCAGMVATVLWSTWRFHRRLERAQPPRDPMLLALLEELSRELHLRRPLLIVETSCVDTPAVTGLWRGRLLLPPGLASLLPHPQLRLVLAHELTHLRRHDLAMTWLMLGLNAMHWFNPLMWYARRCIRSDCELACDAQVLRTASRSERLAYGGALITLLAHARPPRLSGVVGIAQDRDELSERIGLIVQARRWSVPGALLTIACIGLIGCVGLTRAPEPQAPAASTLTPRASPAAAAPAAPAGLARPVDWKQVRELANAGDDLGMLSLLQPLETTPGTSSHVLAMHIVGQDGLPVHGCVYALSYGDFIPEETLPVAPSGCDYLDFGDEQHNSDITIAAPGYEVLHASFLFGDHHVIHRTFRLTPVSASRAGVIEGHVVSDGLGQPLAGADVQVQGLTATTTDDAGQFRIGGLPPGGVYLTVSAPNCYPNTTLVTVVPGHVVRSDWRLYRSQGSTISFRWSYQTRLGSWRLDDDGMQSGSATFELGMGIFLRSGIWCHHHVSDFQVYQKDGALLLWLDRGSSAVRDPRRFNDITQADPRAAYGQLHACRPHQGDCFVVRCQDGHVAKLEITHLTLGVDTTEDQFLTQLRRAIRKDDLATVARLIQEGCRPNPDSDGESSALVTAICSHRVAIVAYLLAHGADPMGTVSGMTPLTWARNQEWPDLASLLLQAGAH